MIKNYILFPTALLLLQVFNCLAPFSLDKSSKHSICIVVPAYNEEDRIERTLKAYVEYFRNIPYLNLKLLIVCNNCSDNTVPICEKQAEKYQEIEVLNFIPGGKGFAVKEGFKAALKKDYELIGFVDADMATEPKYFHDLIIEMDNHDGAIASRYCKGANVAAAHPFLRKISGRVFNWVVQKRFKFKFKDTQCGAKIFTYDTIEKVTPDMVESKWYFDIELLYLCILNHKDIVEVPTTWEDQPGSHLKISGKLIKEFITGQGRVLKRHKAKKEQYKKEKKNRKKAAKQEKALSKKEQRKAKKAARKAQRAQEKADKKAKKFAMKQKRAKEKALRKELKNEKEDLALNFV